MTKAFEEAKKLIEDAIIIDELILGSKKIKELMKEMTKEEKELIKKMFDRKFYELKKR